MLSASVGEFSTSELELLRGLFILALRPEQIAKTEVDARHLRVGLDGIAELLDSILVVAHLVVGFAGQHVRLGGLGIESKDLMVDVENAFVLFCPETAVRQHERIGEILRVASHGIAQVWNRCCVVTRAVIGHADQQAQPLPVR